MEDSAHYLMFCLIFIFFSSPITTAILPVSLFAILHSASYSLTLLDALGAPSSAWGIRFLISIGNVQLFVNLIVILYARWRFKIVCLQTKLASLIIRKKILSL